METWEGGVGLPGRCAFSDYYKRDNFLDTQSHFLPQVL
jgi:hypothetical protein